jgi:RNA-binding protein
MKELSSKDRRALRARAHRLEPVVIVGAGGLSDSVVAEIDRSLTAHELIKIRAPEADREERAALIGAICEQVNAAPVQSIGKMLVVYRPKPEEPIAEGKPEAGRKPARGAARKGRKTAR